MPLDKSGSRESIGKNIKQLRKDGYSEQQAIAVSLSVARKAGADIKKPPKEDKKKK